MIATCLALVLAVQSRTKMPELEIGASLTDEITDDCATIEIAAVANEMIGPLRCVRYGLDLESGQVLSISVRSMYFDTHLGLRNGTGKLIAEDDDGWYLTHSRLVWTVRESGPHVLEVTSLHAGRGPFELNLEAGRAVGPPQAELSTLLLRESSELLVHVANLDATAEPHLGVQFKSLGTQLFHGGHFREAVKCFEAALPRNESKLGPEHPVTLSCLNDYSAALFRCDDLARAIPLLERVVESRRRLVGEHALETLTAVANLGVAYHATGDGSRARECLEGATSNWPGPADDPVLLSFRSELGLVLLDAGAAQEAWQLLEPTLATLERKVGRDHPVTITVTDHLARAARGLGRLDQEKSLAESALEASRRVLGPEHPSTATRTGNLGAILSNLGRNDEAEELLGTALAIQERILGRTNQLTITTVNNLALCMQREGRFEIAEAMHRDALARTREGFGPDHLLVIGGLSNLASSLRECGRFNEAGELLDEALELAARIRGVRHPDYLRTLVASAAVLHQRGELVEAKERYDHAVALQREVLGDDHPQTQVSINNLALLLAELGDFDRAIQLLGQLSKGGQPTRAPELTILGHILLDSGDPAAAASLFEKVHTLALEEFGPNHPRTAEALANLASSRLAMGDSAGALAVAEEAVRACEQTYGDDHRVTGLAYNTWALASADQGDAECASSCFESSLRSLRSCGRAVHPQTAGVGANFALHLLDMERPLAAVAEASRALVDLGDGLDAKMSRLSTATRLALVATLYHVLETLLSAPVTDASTVNEIYALAATWKGRVQRMTLGAGLFKDPEAEAALRRVRDLSARISTLVTSAEVIHPEVRRKQISALQSELASAEEILHATTPPAESGPQVDADAIRRVLPARAAFVDCFAQRVYQPSRLEEGRVTQKGAWSELHLTAFIIRADRPDVARVNLGPQAEVQSALSSYIRAVGVRRGDSAGVASKSDVARGAGMVLREQLWLKLEPMLAGCERVMVSPDGILGAIPFEVIPDGEAGFLIERRAFSYVPDASTLIALAQRSSQTAGRPLRALVVGGVDYRTRSDAPSDHSGATAPRGPTEGGFVRDWQALDGTRVEAELVAKLLGGTGAADDLIVLLTGEAATEEALKNQMERCQIVHVATHGFFQPLELGSSSTELRGILGQERLTSVRGNPLMPGLLSGLVCAGANESPPAGRDNGLLTASEVSWLDLSGCDLAVLSACDTALGEVHPGEGMASLQRAFHVAGARTVIASLWKVEDDATAELMRDVYTRLAAGGATPSAALRSAQLDLLRRNRERDHDAHPETWGAFILSGAVERPD